MVRGLNAGFKSIPYITITPGMKEGLRILRELRASSVVSSYRAAIDISRRPMRHGVTSLYICTIPTYIF